MDSREATIFVDQEVTLRIQSIVEGATKAVILVTPYVKLWGHMKAALERAVKRRIDVRFLIRREPDAIGHDDLHWLMANGIKIYDLPGLHAKIYMNEMEVLISSMNITSSSTINSMEIAIRLVNPRDRKRVQDYVA